MKVFGADICGDCRVFKELMAERGFTVDYVDITASVANLRDFLHLRDHEAAFEAVRAKGSIGIPAFVREDGEVTLDLNTALVWMGQEPPTCSGPSCTLCK